MEQRFTADARGDEDVVVAAQGHEEDEHVERDAVADALPAEELQGVMHQKVIVLLASFVVQWKLGIPLEFPVIAVASPVRALVVRDLCMRRWRPVRFLFGMKPRRR